MPLYEPGPNPIRARAGSKPSWQSTSNNQFMENMFLRKREVEHRRNVLWDSTAKYFDRLQKQNKVFESWNTPEAVERSSEAYTRQRLAEAHKADRYDGPDKPDALVRRDERRFIEAVNSGIPFQGTKDMGKERAIYRERRHAEQRQEASELMQQHWKINDPGFKDLQSRKSTAFIKQPTQDEIREEVRARDNNPKTEQKQKEERIEDSRKYVEDETKLFDNNVVQHVGQIHETQLERWKDAIMNYIQDSKAMRAKEDQLQIEVAKDVSLESCITELVAKRKKVLEKRRESELDHYLGRQFRLRLHHKSCEVEKEIEDDRRIIEELKNLLRFEKDEISDIFSEATIHHDNLIHQKYLETRSRLEHGLLFSEEAAKMWLRQSQKWSDDRMDRSRTFDSLIENLQEMLRIRIQSKRRALESCQSSRQSIDDAVDKLTNDLQHEEERERKQKEEMLEKSKHHHVSDLHVEDLELADTGKPNVSRLERFRNKNELATRLAGWTADGSDKPEMGDFRRKKVKWFDN